MFQILLQSPAATSAIIEIIVMLLGAACIGAVTAYFYGKSKNGKEILSLNSELDENKNSLKILDKQLIDIKGELAHKNDQLDQLENEYAELRDEAEKLMKIHQASRDMYLKAMSEIEETNIKLHATENELKEKDTVLQRVAERKHLLDYESFGRAQSVDKDDLKMISGIGPFIEEKLNMLDIFTFGQISMFSKQDIETVNEAIEFFPGRIDRDEWVPQAQELVYSGGKRTALFERMKSKKHKIDYSKIGIAHREDAQDLTQIHGIGHFIQEKLNFLGIYTFEQISKFTAVDSETVTDIIEFFPGRIERDNWSPQAKELAKQVEIHA